MMDDIKKVDQQAAARQARLAAALRENLKRRKAQIRGRATLASADATTASDDLRSAEHATDDDATTRRQLPTCTDDDA